MTKRKRRNPPKLLLSEIKLIHIGTFIEPIGLKGEIKIKTFTSNPESFTHCGPLMSEDGLITWDLRFVRTTKNNVIVRLPNINTHKEAELFRRKKIFANRTNFPKTKENEFYFTDLINCEIISVDKEVLGVVKSITNYGAGDLINMLQENGSELLIPMNKDNIVSIDLQKKKVVINPMKGIID